MIRVKVIKAGETLLGFECKGHAGYAPEGSDIVCAAASILSTTCANALEEIAKAETQVHILDGYMQVLIDEKSAGHDTQVVMQTVLRGFTDLAEAYPKYLQLK